MHNHDTPQCGGLKYAGGYGVYDEFAINVSKKAPLYFIIGGSWMQSQIVFAIPPNATGEIDNAGTARRAKCKMRGP